MTRYEVLKNKIELCHAAMMRTIGAEAYHTPMSAIWWSHMETLKRKLWSLSIAEACEVVK